MRRAVVFGSEKCGPCHALMGSLDRNNIEYEYVDVDEDFWKFEKYNKLCNIIALPTVFIMQDAELVEVLRGNAGVDKVKACLSGN